MYGSNVHTYVNILFVNNEFINQLKLLYNSVKILVYTHFTNLHHLNKVFETLYVLWYHVVPNSLYWHVFFLLPRKHFSTDFHKTLKGMLQNFKKVTNVIISFKDFNGMVHLSECVHVTLNTNQTECNNKKV